MLTTANSESADEQREAEIRDDAADSPGGAWAFLLARLDQARAERDALLERLHKAEELAQRWELEQRRNVAWMMPVDVIALRDKALEDAAEVAKAYEPECESCPRGVTNAIRALKGPA